LYLNRPNSGGDYYYVQDLADGSDIANRLEPRASFEKPKGQSP